MATDTLALFNHIRGAADEAAKLGNDNEDARNKALNEARDLVRSLERPMEVVMHYSYHLGSQRMSIRVAIDLKIFHILSEADGKPVTADELVQKTKCEKALLVRLMRPLTAIRLVKELDRETYAANELTRTFAQDYAEATVLACYDLPSLIQMKQHEYFKQVGYHAPTDAKDGPMQWTLNSKQSYFDWIGSDETRKWALMTCMTRIRSTRKHWSEWYPVQDNLLKGLSDEKESAILVDVGGALGHDLQTFMKHFPNSKGRLVLQDLPDTIERVGSLDGIHALSHDFFTPNPTKGARAYFFHFVMHDWPDEECRQILHALKPAMTPGYSKILLNEVILPDRDCPAEFAAADLNMMSLLAGMERSQSDWVKLVESAGFDVVAVHFSPFANDSEGVVEAMLKAA